MVLKMERLPTIAVIVAMSFVLPGSGGAEPIPGDINGDGLVSFPDFLILAENFGKTGDPYDPSATGKTTVYDTVKVFVQELVTAIPSEDGVIDGLASVQIASSRRANWDADSDTDGLQFEFWLKDSSDNLLFLTERTKGIEIILEVSLSEVQTGALILFETWKGQLRLFYNNFPSIPILRIEREKLEPYDNRRFNLSIKLFTPKQGTFEAKLSYSLMTEEPKDDHRN